MQELIKEVYALIGKKITFKRIAGNTIILYFDGHPGDSNVKSLWIDPTWRYEKESLYIVGSQDFPWSPEQNQSDEDYKRSFEELCGKTDALIGSKLNQMKIGKASHDLYLECENNQIVKTMMASHEEEGWIYRDHSKGLEIVAFVDRLQKN